MNKSLKVHSSFTGASACFLNRLLIVLVMLATGIYLAGCDHGSDAGEQWSWEQSTGFGRQPLWSPDGGTVLFGDDTPGSSGLFLWIPGGDPERLAPSLPPHNWDYTWSPDGDWIAVTSPGGTHDSTAGLWVVNVTDDSAHRIFDRGRDPSWRRDGGAILFRIDNPETGSPGVFSINFDPASIVLQTSATTLQTGGHQPLCSPADGAYAFIDSEVDGSLHVVAADGGELFTSDRGVIKRDWSADGVRLAFTTNNYTGGSLGDILWSVNLADGEVDSLTTGAIAVTSNRTGDVIVFSKQTYGNLTGMYIFRMPDELVKIAGFGLSPDLHPDGLQVVCHSTVGGVRILRRTN